jgi:poly-beta-1,6-N-acetyl-D-glucosamine synthase
MLSFSSLFTDNQWLIIAIIFLVSLVIQLFYYSFFYLRFVFHRKEDTKSKPEPLSVIICARNEAENLENFLPLILTQDYPDYEVIVVNDCSTDDTANILDRFSKKYPHLRISEIKEDKKFSHGKKIAVAIGIKAAKYDRLLFTDSDCKPESNKWIDRMSANFTDKTSIVLGYGGYFKQPGILNKYIRYDTLTIALQYFSFALAGIPYMGVGRNLAYRRSLFYSGNGFSKHFHLASGDDDLFVNEHATKNNTAIEYSHESHTRSVPKDSFEKWLFQKKRHYSTNRLYKFSHKLLLMTEPFSRFIFYSCFIILLFCPGCLQIIVSAFIVRLILQVLVIKKSMIHFNENNLLLISLLFDPLSIFVNLCLLFVSRFRPANYQWK